LPAYANKRPDRLPHLRQVPPTGLSGGTFTCVNAFSTRVSWTHTWPVPFSSAGTLRRALVCALPLLQWLSSELRLGLDPTEPPSLSLLGAVLRRLWSRPSGLHFALAKGFFSSRFPKRFHKAHCSNFSAERLAGLRYVQNPCRSTSGEAAKDLTAPPSLRLLGTVPGRVAFSFSSVEILRRPWSARYPCHHPRLPALFFRM